MADAGTASTRITPLARLRAWRDAGIANRAALAALVFVATLIGAMLLIAGPVIYRSMADSAADDRRRDGARLQSEFLHRIEDTLESLATLAGSTLVVGALVDADGRDEYLQPMLRDYRPPDRLDREALSLVDLNLQAIGTVRRPGGVAGDLEVARAVIADGRPRVALATDRGAVRFIVPVIDPPARARVGALVLDVSTASLFRTPAGNDPRCFAVASRGRHIHARPCADGQVLDGREPLAVPLPTPGDAALEIELGDASGGVLRAVAGVLGVYLGLAVLAAVLAWILMRRRIAVLTAPLVELSRTAAAIAAEPSCERLAPVVGRDEVGELAVAFNAMLQELRRLHARVADEAQRKAGQIAASAERESLVAVAASEGIWDWDLVADLAYASPKLYEMAGYTAEELPASFAFFERTCHPEDFPGAIAALEAHLRGDTEELVVDARMQTKAGEQRWIMWKGRTVARDAGGRPLRMVGVATDVSARRHAEEALRLSERRYRSLFENLPVGVFHGRLLGPPDGIPEYAAVFLDVNPAFTELSGLRDVVGRRADQILPGIRQTNPEFFENISAVVAGGGRRSFETWMAALGRWFSVAVFSPAPGEFIAAFDDIDERKQAELALRDRETMLRNLGDNLPASYVHRYVRRHGQPSFTYMSSGFERVHGVAAAAALDDFQVWRDLLADGQLPAIAEAVAHSERTLRDFSMQLRLRGRDGDWRWIELRSRPTRVDAATVVWDGVSTDITERKSTELALRRSEQLYRAVVDSMVEGIVVVDADGHTVSCNPRAAEILGRPAEELIQAELFDSRWGLLGEDGNALAAESLPVAQSLRSGEPRSGEVVGIVRPDGRPVWLLLNTGPMRDPQDGRLSGVVVSLLDISERRRIQAELAENEEMFRLAYLGTPVGVAILARDGTVVRANPALCSITGYHESDLAGRRLQRFMPAGQRERDEALLRRLVAGEIAEIAVEQQMLGAAGQALLLRCVTAAVRDDRGRVLSLIAQIEDVTERRRAETEDLAASILAAQEVERARLSHELHDEIGQSLTALKIALQHARQRCQGSVSEELFAPAKQIIEHLTADVRRISHRLRPSELDQLGLVAALRAHLDRIARPESLAFEFRENLGDRRLPASVELCCFRVVQEALTNCLRHAGASRFSVSLTLDDTGLALRVIDDGIGLDLAGKLRPAAEGGSLGLLGMRERVFGAGGRITFESHPGTGLAIAVTFTLDIIGR